MREKKWSHAKTGLGGLELLYNSTSFIFLSNLADNLRTIFLTASDYFQATSFVLKGFMFLFLTVKYAFSPNKNIGKLGSWLLAALQATFAAAGIIVALTLGTVGVAIISTLSIVVDLAINLIKSIYFLIKSETATDPKDRQFFREKGKKAALGLVFTGVGVMLFILVSMGAPFIGLSVAGAIALTVGIIVAALGIYAIASAIHKTFFSSETKDNKPSEEVVELEDLAKLQDTEELNEALEFESKYVKAPRKNSLDNDREIELENVSKWKENRSPHVEEASKSSHYWQHQFVSSAKPHEIINSIQQQKQDLEDAIELDNQKSGFFSQLFSEETKRENKVAALTILEDFVDQIKNHKIHSDGGELKISGVGKTTKGFKIEYSDVDDLKSKFDNYITKNFPGVYQSFYQKRGTTESLFAQTYKLLDDHHYVRSSKVKVDESKVDGKSEVEAATRKTVL